MNVPLPYDLTEDDLILDSAAKDETTDSAMSRLVDHVSWSDEEAMEHIFRGAVLLKVKHPEYNLGQCIATASIWYYG